MSDCQGLLSLKEAGLMFIERAIPQSAFFEVTYRCNVSCKHCLIDCHETEMSISQIESVLDKIKSMGVFYLIITGGEPFVRDDIFDILRAAIKRKFAIRLFSNATLIDDSIASQLAELGTIWVEISLLAATDKTYEEITQLTGSLQKVKNAITALKAHGHIVVTKSPIMTLNYDERHEIPKLATSLGAVWRGFDPSIIPTVCGDSRPLEYMLTESQMIDHHMEAIEQGDYLPELFLARAEDVKDRRACGAGLGVVGITPDGRMTPCGGFRKHGVDMLSAVTDPLTIWNEHPIFTEPRQIHLRDLKDCVGCDELYLCNRCIAVSHALFGDLRRGASCYCRPAKTLRKAYERLQKTKMQHQNV